MSTTDLSTRKDEIRKAAHAARKAQPDKDAVSSLITDRVQALEGGRGGKTVMYYVDVREEVRTRQALPQAIQSDKRIIIPYCVDGELELFWLQSMDELEEGAYRILEPKAELRDVAEKKIAVEALELILVPGVAFDKLGGRTGHGKGYYDKLLEHAKLTTPLVALAFECQMFAEIPMQAHDIYMDLVVTEKATYQGRGRNTK
jgi:5-formyltetrahydrofolate cyclo-ligase